MDDMYRRRRRSVSRALTIVGLLLIAAGRCRSQGPPAAARDGLAAAIAIDVSGSMDDRVTGEDGRRSRKIDVARRAARDLVEQFASYAEQHPGEPVLLGVYEFSRRSGVDDCRPILPMGAPD